MELVPRRIDHTIFRSVHAYKFSQVSPKDHTQHKNKDHQHGSRSNYRRNCCSRNWRRSSEEIQGQKAEEEDEKGHGTLQT